MWVHPPNTEPTVKESMSADYVPGLPWALGDRDECDVVLATEELSKYEGRAKHMCEYIADNTIFGGQKKSGKSRRQTIKFSEYRKWEVDI